MKLAVLIASRNNPLGLETVISALSMLATGQHEITYCVAVDKDDPITLQSLDRLAGQSISVRAFVGERPICLGQPYNIMAAQLPDVDAYCMATDRTLPLTQYRDAAIALALAQKDGHAYWWRSSAGDTQILPVVSARWYKAAGQIYTNYFSFWFDDTWLYELCVLVYGMPHLVLPITFGGVRKHGTNRLRELRFWMDFFIATRPERIAHAERIAKNLGIERPANLDNVFAETRHRESVWEAKCQEWEKIFGDSPRARRRLSSGQGAGRGAYGEACRPACNVALRPKISQEAVWQACS